MPMVVVNTYAETRKEATGANVKLDLNWLRNTNVKVSC